MSDLDKLAEEILACNPKDEVYHVPYGLLAEEGTSVCEMERLQAMVREWQEAKAFLSSFIEDNGTYYSLPPTETPVTTHGEDNEN